MGRLNKCFVVGKECGNGNVVELLNYSQMLSNLGRSHIGSAPLRSAILDQNIRSRLALSSHTPSPHLLMTEQNAS